MSPNNTGWFPLLFFLVLWDWKTKPIFPPVTCTATPSIDFRDQKHNKFRKKKEEATITQLEHFVRKCARKGEATIATLILNKKKM